MVYMDAAGEGAWVPLCCYALRWGRRGAKWEDSPMGLFAKEGLEAGADWAPLRAGLFGGDAVRFRELVERNREVLTEILRGGGR